MFEIEGKESQFKFAPHFRLGEGTGARQGHLRIMLQVLRDYQLYVEFNMCEF